MYQDDTAILSEKHFSPIQGTLWVWLIAFLLLLPHWVFAQSEDEGLCAVHTLAMGSGGSNQLAPCIDSLEIASIAILGNKTTKEWVVFREMRLRVGDKVHRSQLDSLLKVEASKVFNTNLFITSDIAYNQCGNNKVRLSVSVLEKLYTFPMPVIDIGDRNFNEWWQQRNRDLSRLVYGFTFKRHNFRGRNEHLAIGFTLGFRKQLKLHYSIPFINKKKTVGLGIQFDYTTHHTLAYKAIAHTLSFITADAPIGKNIDFSVNIRKRKGYYGQHNVELGYRHQEVADTVMSLNPDYFGNGRKLSKLLSFSYRYTYDLRNIRAYPTKGSYLALGLQQYGLGLLSSGRQSIATAQLAKYVTLSKHSFFATEASAVLSTSSYKGFANAQGLGYGQSIVRGYDLYMVDGAQSFVSRNTLSTKILERVFKADFLPFKEFSTIPVSVCPKIFFDVGYVRNMRIHTEKAKLTNILLKGWGVGLDIITFYNGVVRLEYSMNAEGGNGLFFYWKASF
jgi:outer membrane protein assembly factor BamA